MQFAVKLGNYTLLALCATVAVGCGSAPSITTKPDTTVSTLETNPIPSADGKGMESVTNVVAETEVETSASQHNNSQADTLRQRRMAELEAKRAEYQRKWEADQRRKEAELDIERQRRVAAAANERERRQVEAEAKRKHQQIEADIAAKRRQYQAAFEQRQAEAEQQAQQNQVRTAAQQQRHAQVNELRRVPRAPAPRALQPVLSKGSYGGQGNGNYYATELTGPYTNNPQVLNFVERMVRQGFSREYLYGVFSQARFEDSVAAIWTKYYAGGGESPKPKTGSGGPGGWTSYRNKFVTPGNLQKGQQFWAEYAPYLARAEQQYGVPAEYIVGILGVETRWGRIFGNYRIVDALLTSGVHVQHRQKFFFDELENFFLMTRSERMDPLKPVGSYAGAMGYGQFMPSSFHSYAVDFDGDGIRDLWNPADAIGSVANYFAKHGWRPGEAVAIPAQASSNSYYSMDDGFKVKYSMGTLASKGITPAAPVRASGSVHLLALSVDGGKEPWIGFNNFYVITRYNHSNYYAMAVYSLGEAVKERIGATYAQR